MPTKVGLRVVIVNFRVTHEEDNVSTKRQKQKTNENPKKE